MPLMTNLYTGVSGLTSSQNAINISAHNLANIYTDGYVRQQAQFSDRQYSTYGQSEVNTMQIGYGVDSATTTHYRDILLDKAYRQESGREGYYTAQYEAVSEIETILGELNGQAFQTSLSDLWSAISEVAKTPDSAVARSSLIMNAETFINRAKEVYSDLVNYQERIDVKIEETVNRINEIGDEIHRLNLLIQGVEAPDVEQAMDYRDQRDLLVDELGSLISITYTETADGYLTIRAEGEEFVTKGGCFHMGMETLNGQDGSTFVTPVWPQNAGKEVYNLSVEITSAKNNDVGELKALVQLRGGYSATYQDIPHIDDPPQQEDYTDENGVVDTEAFNAAVEKFWNEDYPAYEDAVFTYDTTVGNSVLMKTQAMFDQLINQIVTTINDLLCPNSTQTIAAGTELTISAGAIYNQLDDGMKSALEAAGVDVDAVFGEDGELDEDFTFTLTEDMTITALDLTDTDGDGHKAGYGMDADHTTGTELFSRDDTIGRYTVLTDGDGNQIYMYNAYNEFGTSGEYTITNLEVNQAVLDDYSLLPFHTEDKMVDMQLGQDILDAWDTPSVNLNPDNMTLKDFADYYSAMMSVIANDGSVYKTLSENQNTVVSTLSDSRTSFTGVSSNDELTNLIKFQNAYNANSRYINVITEMLDTLINKVGNW